jgi:YD repeat-containing protein
MSQVKKLQAGGKFIIDGQEINGNDAINAVRSYLGETTGGIMNALREGQTVDYNSADNTISITNNEGQSLTNDYLPAGEKASVMDSKFKKD